MDCDLYFLCGTDMLLSFDTWYMPDYIFDNATIVYARRENDKENSEQIPIKISEYEKLYNAKIIHLDVKVIEVSSSEIRREIDEVGKSSYLTCEVLDFISKNNLYNE
jgi:nicotinate-nucleotide adenylyltransferase